MITGELKSKVDKIWDTMWSGGISNPLSVIEQLTYLLFIKRLDELQTLKESKGRAHQETHQRSDLHGQAKKTAMVPLQGNLARADVSKPSRTRSSPSSRPSAKMKMARRATTPST